MNTAYNLNEFGNALRKIRMRLHYTHQGVYNATGVHRDTMRKLENGLVIPKIETLEILSRLFDVNLLMVFNAYRINQNLYELYFNHEKELLTADDVRYNQLYKQLMSEIPDYNSKTIEKEQLIAILKGMRSNDEGVFQNIQKTLEMPHKGLTIDNFHTYPLNRFEHRLLIHMAVYKSRIKMYSQSNGLFYRLYHTLDKSEIASKNEKVMVCNVFKTLAHNHLHLSNDIKASNTSDIGIKYSIQQGVFYFLSDLMSIKAESMLKTDTFASQHYKEQSKALKMILETEV